MTEPKCRVLCVDDHRDTSDMLQMLLSEEDYEVHTAATMQEACSMALRYSNTIFTFSISVCLTAQGYSCVRRCGKLTPSVPCIFYTGDAYEMHRREAFEAGAVAFVAKPDIEGLINAVHQLLSAKECAAAT